MCNVSCVLCVMVSPAVMFNEIVCNHYIAMLRSDIPTSHDPRPSFENAILSRRTHQHTDSHFVDEAGRQRGDGGGDGNVFG